MPGAVRSLPITVDRLTPAHLPRRVWRPPGWSGGWHSLVTTAGILLALGGAWLGLQPENVDAGFTRDGYRVGGTLLQREASDTYGGPAALVIVRDTGGVRAASSARLHGIRVRGICYADVSGDSERCLFMFAGRSLVAVDRRIPSGWSRHYEEGTDVTITTLGKAITPVPFLVGYPGV